MRLPVDYCVNDLVLPCAVCCARGRRGASVWCVRLLANSLFVRAQSHHSLPLSTHTPAQPKPRAQRFTTIKERCGQD